LQLGEIETGEMYQALDWLLKRQVRIENKLAKKHLAEGTLILYDVTSSYLEGEHNALADWGYNRDRKRAKSRLSSGYCAMRPESRSRSRCLRATRAIWRPSPIRCARSCKRFGCRRVTFVGDRGMIKSAQVEDLARAGFHYITAITKAQIRSLIKKGIFQLGLFDQHLCEVQYEGVRYVLRRNPVRAQEMASTRASKPAAFRPWPLSKTATLPSTCVQINTRRG